MWNTRKLLIVQSDHYLDVDTLHDISSICTKAVYDCTNPTNYVKVFQVDYLRMVSLLMMALVTYVVIFLLQILVICCEVVHLSRLSHFLYWKCRIFYGHFCEIIIGTEIDLVTLLEIGPTKNLRFRNFSLKYILRGWRNFFDISNDWITQYTLGHGSTKLGQLVISYISMHVWFRHLNIGSIPNNNSCVYHAAAMGSIPKHNIYVFQLFIGNDI